MVRKTLSLGFYRTFAVAKWGFDRTFGGSMEPFLGVRYNVVEDSIEPFWGRRRFEGTV